MVYFKSWPFQSYVFWIPPPWNGQPELDVHHGFLAGMRTSTSNFRFLYSDSALRHFEWYQNVTHIHIDITFDCSDIRIRSWPWVHKSILSIAPAWVLPITDFEINLQSTITIVEEFNKLWWITSSNLKLNLYQNEKQTCLEASILLEGNHTE